MQTEIHRRDHPSKWQALVEQLRAGRFVPIKQNRFMRSRRVKPVAAKPPNVVWSLSEFWKRLN